MEEKNIKFPCWAVGVNKSTEEVEIYTFVTNKTDCYKAEQDYKKILGDKLKFVLQKTEPFAGW